MNHQTSHTSSPAEPQSDRPRDLRRLNTPRLLVLAILLLGALPGVATAQDGSLDLRGSNRFGAPGKATIEAFTDRTSYVAGETARILVRVIIEESWHIQAHVPTYDYLIPTELAVISTDSNYLLISHPGSAKQVSLEQSSPDQDVEERARAGRILLVLDPVLYPAPIQWSAPFADNEILAIYDGETFVEASIQIPVDTPPAEVELALTLAYQACDDRLCVAPNDTTTNVLLPIGTAGEAQYQDMFAAAVASRNAGEAGGESAHQQSTPGGRGRSLGWMLAFGFLGGLLLNLMPCVLPVLSIKIFGLLQSAEKGHGSVRSGALAFAAGILVSFWLLALAAIGLRAAGEAIGWGIQFQNPMFVAFLTLVMVFFSLNLWGLFEIPMPRFLGGQGSGEGQGEGHGLAGHFMAGLFATLMATPCSAPFLGSAVGFALARPPFIILAIFTAVGLGLAAPNLLLAVSPRAAALLPRPGVWMETLKGVFGFLLAGTAVWLLYVLNNQIAPESLAFVQGTLLLVGLFAFLHHRWTRQRGRQTVALVGVLAAALCTLWIANTAPPALAESAGSLSNGSAYSWLAFDEAEAQRISEEGGLVFVDVTADWCATCKVNERVVLGNSDVQAAFASHEVIMMKADWTNRNETIARYLADFGRYAIPFYVLYRPGSEPHVFGELLTKKAVVKALEESGSQLASRLED